MAPRWRNAQDRLIQPPCPTRRSQRASRPTGPLASRHPCAAKPQGVIGEGGPAASTSRSVAVMAQEPGPRPAAAHPRSKSRQVLPPIPRTVRIGFQHRGAPFPHVSDHVQRATPRGPRRTAAHRQRASPAVLPPDRVVRIPFASPRIHPTLRTARHVLPFGLRRQAQPCPLGIGIGVKPAHVHHRSIISPACRAGPPPAPRVMPRSRRQTA